MSAFDDLIPQKKKPSGFDDLIPPDPTEGMKWWEKALAGAGKAFVDTGRGVRQLGAMVGIGDEQAIQQEIDDAQQRDAALMNTGAGIAGNIGGQLATMVGPAAAVGAVGKAAKLPSIINAGKSLALPTTVRGAAAQGAAFGGIQPVATGEDRMTKMGVGAAGGALGSAIPKVAGAVVKPKVSADVTALMREGVTPTPGQILGGAFNRIEEGAQSVPIVGDAIKSARTRAMNDLNRAAYNRALNPVGKEAGQAVGYEGVRAVRKALSAEYDAIVPELRASYSNELNASLDAVRSEMKAALPQYRKQFDSILKREVMDRFDDKMLMTGEDLKRAESSLGRLARGFSRSENMNSRILGEQLEGVQAALRQEAARQSPKHAERLAQINEGWANYTRIRKASSALGSRDGVFSSAQLRGAAKAGDSTAGKRASSEGDALMQDLANRGERVLGAKVPDSGTPFRTANIAAALGGAYFEPTALLGAGAGSALYSKAGQKALAKLLTERPEYAEAIAEALRKQSPYLAAPTSSYLLSQ